MHFPPASEKHANDFTRGNCAIFVTLTHIPSNKQLQVVGTHLHWNGEREFVKYA